MMAVILKIPSSFPEWDANDQAVYDKLLVIGEPFAFCTTPLNMLNRGQKNIIKESFRGRILFIGEKSFQYFHYRAMRDGRLNLQDSVIFLVV